MELYVCPSTVCAGTTECYYYVLLHAVKQHSCKLLFGLLELQVSQLNIALFYLFFCRTGKVFFVAKATIFCPMQRNVESTQHKLFVNLSKVFFSFSTCTVHFYYFVKQPTKAQLLKLL